MTDIMKFCGLLCGYNNRPWAWINTPLPHARPRALVTLATGYIQNLCARTKSNACWVGRVRNPLRINVTLSIFSMANDIDGDGNEGVACRT